MSFKNIFCVILILALAAGLCSCGDPYAGYAEKLVGTWSSEKAGPDRYWTYVFNEDGTGNQSFVQHGDDSLSFSFSYTVSGNELTLINEGGDVDCIIKLEKPDLLKLTVSRVTTEFERVTDD